MEVIYECDDDGMLTVRDQPRRNRDGKPSAPEFAVTINLHDALAALEDDEQKAAALAIGRGVVEESVIARLMNTEWDSDDDTRRLRLRFLCAMEKEVVSGFKWNILRDLGKTIQAAVAADINAQRATDHIRALYDALRKVKTIDGVDASQWRDNQDLPMTISVRKDDTYNHDLTKAIKALVSERLDAAVADMVKVSEEWRFSDDNTPAAIVAAMNNTPETT